MNSAERVLTTLEGKPADRRAVCATLSLYGARLTECPLTEYYTVPTAYARGQSAVREIFQPDILLGTFALPLEGQAFGSKVRFFDRQAPNLARPVIRSATEIGQLNVPDIDSHPSLMFIREAIRLMAAEHGGEVPIAAIALNPVDLPTMIMGIDAWLETVLFDEDGTRRMLDVTVPHFVRWANALLGDGAAFVVLPASFVNPVILTREIAGRFAIPVMKEAFRQVNGPLVIHSGGAPLAPYLDLFAGLPNVAGFVLNGGDSLTEARDKCGTDVTLIGNIDGPTLSKREPGDIKAECRRILLDRQDDPRFILGSAAADIGFDTPAESIHALCQATSAFAANQSE